MNNLEPVLDNETHEHLLDLGIQTNHLIPAKRQKFLPKKKRDKSLDFSKELKKTVEHVG